jgi:signal peptidase I
MYPTIKTHDLIITNKFEYGIRIPQTNRYLFRYSRPVAGDIVLLEGDEFSYMHSWVKRVVAVGGDRILIKGKKIFINGIEVVCSNKIETYLGYMCDESLNGEVQYKVKWFDRAIEDADYFSEFTVPKDHVFLIGDNRNNSLDSRYIGAIHIDKVYGKLKFIFSGVTDIFNYTLYALMLMILCWDKIILIIRRGLRK